MKHKKCVVCETKDLKVFKKKTYIHFSVFKSLTQTVVTYICCTVMFESGVVLD